MSSEGRTTERELITPPADLTLRALEQGQRIAGRFRLVRLLGKGGMGVVWLAEDESLDESVAFKFLAEIVAQDESAVLDLKRELRRSRQLTHAHIIRVHDLVEDPARGVAGITLELAAGGSLAARRARTEHGWFEPEELAEWVRQMCEALDYAHHTARVVHRDLKPANLLLDGTGRLKIADFGIAAALHESATRLTAGKISGTPVYMSPQQWQGHPPTPSDDLYALGATIYDLLTGKPPFYSGDIASAVAELPPAPMAQRRRELADIDAPVPPAWEQAVGALLAKEPQDRPVSAGEFAARLGLSPAPHSPPRGTLRVAPRNEPPPIVDAPTGESTTVVTAAQGAPVDNGVPPEVTRRRENSPQAPTGQPRIWRGVLAGCALLAVCAAAIPLLRHSPDAAPKQTEGMTKSPEPRPMMDAPSIAPATQKTWPVRLRVGSQFTLFDGGYVYVRGPYRWLDERGQIAITGTWETTRNFREGLAFVTDLPGTSSRRGFIEVTGKLAFSVSPHVGGGDFSEDLAAVQAADRRFGFIDRTGRFVIEPRWALAGIFSEGLAAVQEADPAIGKFGYIDKSGKVVIEPQWEQARPFAESWAPVKKGGKWGYIEPSGRVALAPRWDLAEGFVAGRAIVAEKGAAGRLRYLAIDGGGAPIFEFSEEISVTDFSGRFYSGKRGDGKCGFLDEFGEPVRAFEYDLVELYRPSRQGPAYWHVVTLRPPASALAQWLDDQLQEIWRGELPVAEPEVRPAMPVNRESPPR